MIGQHFNMPKYDWDIEVYYNVNKYDINFCIKKLKQLATKIKVHKECYKTLYTDKLDRAYVYSSYNRKLSIVFIGEPSSTGEFINTITHEANHIKSHIATYYGIDEKDEEVCYMIGGIVKEMSETFIRFICNKCLDI